MTEFTGIPKLILYPCTLKDNIIGILENINEKIVIRVNPDNVLFNYQINDLKTACVNNEELTIKGILNDYKNYPCVDVQEIKYY